MPRGKNLITLRDAALYITKLPKAEHDAEEWQAARIRLSLKPSLRACKSAKVHLKVTHLGVAHHGRYFHRRLSQLQS